jgi:hypothetical protein
MRQEYISLRIFSPKISGLDDWLMKATRNLSDDSAAQVRTEIQEHYESTREAAMNGGATADEADLLALAALGNAGEANCQYRKVLLTSAEAKLLGKRDWGSRVSVIVLCAAMMLFHTGAIDVAWIFLIGGMGVGFLFLVPLLPIYTPRRSRVVRYAKWIVLTGMLVLPCWPGAFKFPWLLGLLAGYSLLPLYGDERMRISIRRKLPVAQWPKHLYL